MANLRTDVLFHGSVVSIADVRCRAGRSPCGGEEHAGDHELVVTRSGVFVKHTGRAGRHQVVADATRALLLNRHEPYRVSHPAAGGDECTTLAVRDDVLVELVAMHDRTAGDRPGAPFAVGDVPLAPPLLLRFHHLRRRLRSGWSSPLEVEEEALALLDGVVCDGHRRRQTRTPAARAGTRRARGELVERARAALAVRLEARLSLAALAAAVGCSPFHLARTFRASTGSSVHQYQLRLRLSLALDRLADGAHNLSALALDLGFASHSHFATVFRRTFGATPSAFRRALSGAALRDARKIAGD